MIEISTDKVVHIIYQSRESGRSADAEVHAFIDALNEDEKAHLTAIAWVGRGAYEADAYIEAVAMARAGAACPAGIDPSALSPRPAPWRPPR